MLGISHSTEVHRFDMHASRTPKGQSNRCTCARSSDCAEASFWRFNRFFLLPFRLFLGRIPQTFYTFVQVFCAQQMARPPHQVCRRKIVFPTVGFDQLSAHQRRDAIGDSPAQQENQKTRKGTEHIIEGTCAGFEARRRGSDGEGVTAR